MKHFFSTRFFGFVICLCTLIYTACQKTELNSPSVSEPGEILAKKYCSSCHLFPEPDLLDKNTWTAHTLPAMGHRFGIYHDRARNSLLEKGMARSIVEQANVFPSKQTISKEEWDAIIRYYKDNAPEKLALSSDTLSVRRRPVFQPKVPPFRMTQPAVSALTYDRKRGQLYVANSLQENHSSITILDNALNPITSLGLPHPVSNLTLQNDTLFVLLMGHFVPSDEPAGQLLRAVKSRDGKYEGYQRVVKNLKRPVDAAFGDLSGDGVDEIVICEFGNHTGSVSLFVKDGKSSFRKTVLLNAAGATKVMLEDMNGDEQKDIIVLMSQGDEGIDIYFNLGKLKFERKRVLRFPPVYGSVSFRLTDLNDDGSKDIVYVNGDNADASRVPKPYHGIRMFVNDRHNNFVERYFVAFDGAYDALVQDFDKDGDEDVGAVSFFGDIVHHPERGFVYLENVSQNDQLAFSPALIEGVKDGRWITMTSGDLNRDGFEDIILGSFTTMDIMGDSLNTTRNELIHKAQPLLLLENKMGDEQQHSRFK
jgi:hypothetical protein